MMSTDDMKYNETTEGRLHSKDDQKQQHFEARSGMKQTTMLAEQIIAQPTDIDASIPRLSGQPTNNAALAGLIQPSDLKAEMAELHHVTPIVHSSLDTMAKANGALAPVVLQSDLKEEMSHLKHVSGLREGEFGSIHLAGGESEPSVVTFHNKPVEATEKPSLDRRTSGDPVPSQLELPAQIGESAAKGFEMIKKRAEPQIEKAKELYHIWRGEEVRQTSGDEKSMPKAQDDSASHSSTVLEQAKDGFATMKASAEKMFEESVKPQVESIHEKATDAYQAYQRKGANKREAKTDEAPTSAPSEDMSHRMQRYKNKAMEIWEGEEPIVKEKISLATRTIKEKGLELPLLALATLFTLWASFMFIGWFAFPKTSPAYEQMVVYQPHGAVPVEHAQAIHEPIFHPATGPSQDVPNAGAIDKLTMRIHDLEDKLEHSMSDIKMKGVDRMIHAKDAVVGAMPSMPSTGDMKDSMADMKDRVIDMKDNAADRLSDLKDTAAERMGDIKQRMNGANTMQADEPNAPPHMHTAIDGLNPDQRFATIEGQQHITEQLAQPVA